MTFVVIFAVHKYNEMKNENFWMKTVNIWHLWYGNNRPILHHKAFILTSCINYNMSFHWCFLLYFSLPICLSKATSLCDPLKSFAFIRLKIDLQEEWPATSNWRFVWRERVSLGLRCLWPMKRHFSREAEGSAGARRHFTLLFTSTAGNKTPNDLVRLHPVTLLTQSWHQIHSSPDRVIAFIWIGCELTVRYDTWGNVCE